MTRLSKTTTMFEYWIKEDFIFLISREFLNLKQSNKMTLEKYIQYRTGATKVSIIARNMFLKPFTASSLRSFWKYWNPGLGYYLLYYCYKPLRSLFPHWICLIITFLACGLAHDVTYIAPMMLMNGGKFVLPFVTTWFLIIALGVLLTDYLRISFNNINALFRPILHFAFLAITFCITRYIDLLLY